MRSKARHTRRLYLPIQRSDWPGRRPLQLGTWHQALAEEGLSSTRLPLHAAIMLALVSTTSGIKAPHPNNECELLDVDLFGVHEVRERVPVRRRVGLLDVLRLLLGLGLMLLLSILVWSRLRLR